MLAQGRGWVLHCYRIVTIPTWGLWVLWLLHNAVTPLSRYMLILVECTWFWMRSMPFWIFFYLKWVSWIKYSTTFVISIISFYIVAALDASSKLISRYLSMAVDGNFFIIVYVYISLYTSKITVNVTQPLPTSI